MTMTNIGWIDDAISKTDSDLEIIFFYSVFFNILK